MHMMLNFFFASFFFVNIFMIVNKYKTEWGELSALLASVSAFVCISPHSVILVTKDQIEF